MDIVFALIFASSIIKATLACDAGKAYVYSTFATSGQCSQRMANADDCAAAATANKLMGIDSNQGYLGHTEYTSESPSGCYHYGTPPYASGKYKFNTNHYSSHYCTSLEKCICGNKVCHNCPTGYDSEDGASICKVCFNY